MADRSDDIKQLFSHLGLNPTDYQELHERTRAVTRTRAVPPAPAPAAAKAAPAAKPQAPVAPLTVPVMIPPLVTAPPPAMAPAPAAPPTANLSPAPAAASMTPPSPATSPLASGADAGRWSLLRAAADGPAASPAPVAPPPATVAPPRAPTSAPAPAATPVQSLYAPLPPLPNTPVADEDRPTRRLFKELSRAPVEETVKQLAEGASRRWQAPPAAPSVPAAPPPAAAGGRLQFRYGAATDAAASAPETLGEVFRRLASYANAR